MKNIFFTIAIAASLCLAQDQVSKFEFTPEPLSLGHMEQGTLKHIVLQGKNITKSIVQLESVIDQNVGGSNFVYPKTIAAGQKFQVEFDLNTRGIEGPFNHQIVLIEQGGKPSVTRVEGTIDSPILFSQQMLDAGYVTADSKLQWTIYAWCPKGTKFPLALDSASSARFTLQSTEVLLDTQKFDEIKEGGSAQGLKLTLTAKDFGKGPANPKIRSIRQIVGFTSPNWPKANPEILIVGFWK